MLDKYERSGKKRFLMMIIGVAFFAITIATNAIFVYNAFVHSYIFRDRIFAVALGALLILMAVFVIAFHKRWIGLATQQFTLKTVIDGLSSELFVLTDNDEKIIMLNNAAKKFFALTDSAFGNIMINDLIVFGVAEIPIKPIETTDCKKFYGFSKDGKTEFEIIESVATQKSGKIYLLHDITAMRKNEQELENYRRKLEAIVATRTDELNITEQRYQSLIENVNVGVCILKQTLEFDYINNYARSIFALENDTSTQETKLSSFIDTETTELFFEKIEIAKQNQETRFDIQVHLPNGASKELATTITAIKPHRRASLDLPLLCIFQDVTHRRATERKLKESEMRFRKIVENSGDGILIVDNDDTVLMANSSAENMLGFRIEDVLGKHVSFPLKVGEMREVRLYGNDNSESIVELFTTEIEFDGKAAKLASIRDITHHIRYKMAQRQIAREAQQKNAELQKAYDELERTQLANVNMMDDLSREVETRKQKEAELTKLSAELERHVAERTAQLAATVRELEAFSYSVSHDLRAPVRHVSYFSQTILDDLSEGLSAEAIQYLQRINIAAKNMDELINALLSLSRISRTRIVLDDVNLSEMAQEVLNERMALEPDRQVEIHIQPNLICHADRKLMRVVLENLLGNAWKFSAKVVPSIIELGVFEGDGKRKFFVRDNGAGFDMKYAQKLFTPFQRLHGPEEFEGTGIGLATVQRVFAMHGGSVKIFGEVGIGTTILFELS